jgi:hypothetical protein
MMEKQVVRLAGIHELPVIAREMLEAVIRGLNEDVGFVPRGSQYALNAKSLVTDRVTTPEGGENLVNGGRLHGSHDRLPVRCEGLPRGDRECRHERRRSGNERSRPAVIGGPSDTDSREPELPWAGSSGSEGPAGSAATTSDAGGQSGARRANHPGSGSMPRRSVSFESRSMTSRYFRSMTGQS